MNDRKVTEEEAENALIHIGALRMYSWVQKLWVALIVEVTLIPVLMILLSERHHETTQFDTRR